VRAFYLASVTLHVMAALLWLGGMFFLGLVGAPVLRGVEPPALRQRLFQDLGLRFRGIGWACISVLLITGMQNLWMRGWLEWDGTLGTAAFWRSGSGQALALKLTTVVVMITTSSIHDFWLGPAVGRHPAGSIRAISLRRRASLLARITALTGVILVIAAVRLARGG
jgi:uncharacterized membrane protein